MCSWDDLLGYRQRLIILRNVPGALYRRAVEHGHVPAPHVRILVQVDLLPIVAGGPRPDGHVRDRVFVDNVVAALEALVEHTVEAARLDLIAGPGILGRLGVVLREVAREVAGVTRGNLLVDADHERIAIAIDEDRFHGLRVAGGLALQHHAPLRPAEDEQVVLPVLLQVQHAAGPPAHAVAADVLEHELQTIVALALVENGDVKIGVLGCPNLTDGYISEPGGAGTLMIAVRGEGTWLTEMDNAENNDWKRIQVSPRANPSEARLMRSFESGHTDVSKIDEIASALGTEADPIRMDSQAKYSVLAAGEGEVILRLLSPKMPNYQEKIWDQAAGAIVLEEAGGGISDLDGKPLDFSSGRKLVNNRGVLATNGHLHEAALKALKEVGA